MLWHTLACRVLNIAVFEMSWTWTCSRVGRESGQVSCSTSLGLYSLPLTSGRLWYFRGGTSPDHGPLLVEFPSLGTVPWWLEMYDPFTMSSQLSAHYTWGWAEESSVEGCPHGSQRIHCWQFLSSWLLRPCSQMDWIFVYRFSSFLRTGERMDGWSRDRGTADRWPPHSITF